MNYVEAVPGKHGRMLMLATDINQYRAYRDTGASLDEPMLDAIRSVARPDWTFFDVGANFGVYSLAVAPYVKCVLAFEPQPLLAGLVAGTMAMNMIENVVVFPVAVGDSDARIALPKFDYTQACNFGSIEFGPQQMEPLSQQRQASTRFVRQITLDSLRCDRVDYIKIDVEGMEAQVLRGAQQVLRDQRPIVQVEVLKSDKLRLLSLLRDYAVYDLGADYLALPSGAKFELVGAQRVA